MDKNSTKILITAEELLGKTSGREPPCEENCWWILNTQDEKEAGATYDRNKSEKNVSLENANKEQKTS